MAYNDGTAYKPHRMKEVWQDRIYNNAVLFLILVILFLMLYPLYLIVISSISNPGLVALGEVTLYPKEITFTGYEALLSYRALWRSYLNSIIYTIAGTAISIGVTMAAAYTLSRNFPGKKIISFLFIFTMFFGGGLIPTFLVMRNIGLYNTPWICILMGCVSVWNVMVARTYIKSTIPESLYEAAVLDGASHWRYFLHVVLPLSGTIIAVLSVYYGVGKWNDYWTGLVYIANDRWLPLQTVLRRLLATLTVNTELINISGDISESQIIRLQRAELAKYGIIVITTAPAIVLYLCMQKFFVKGVMIGSLKG
jgi:putative aldouronate transport system permease protein